MKLEYLALALGFYCIWPAAAYQWPLENSQISGSFARNRTGLPEKNLALASFNAEVRPAEQGEIIFKQTQNSILPNKKGSTVIVQHGEDMRTVYAELAELADLQDKKVNEETLLGKSAAAGGGRYTFKLAFYDNRLRQFVNPSFFLPARSSAYRASIASVVFKSRAGEEFPVANGVTLPAGEFEVFVNSYSLAANGADRLAPYSLSLEVMGDIIAKVQGDAFISIKGETFLTGGNRINAENLYDRLGRIRLGSVMLSPGQANLTVRAADTEARQTTMSMRIFVNESLS